MSQHQITVYYDGLCRVCSAEINHYKKMKGAASILFKDITSSDFNAAVENLDPQKIHRELHARDSQGNIVTGVDTFILIWSHLDRLHRLSRLAKKTWFNNFLKLNYAAFVKVRPYLPRKTCSDSPYCEIKHT